MNPFGLQLRCMGRIWSDDFGFWVVQTERDGYSLGKAVTMEKRAEGSMFDPEPTFALERPQAQQLMDELWGAGLRPTQGKQSEGVTAAQARHLDDMRAIVAKKLDVQLPGANK